ncbi:MAG: hypothetical protein RR482_01045 [Clostridia bacterium]
MKQLRIHGVLQYQIRTGKRGFLLICGVVALLLGINFLLPLVISGARYTYADYSDGGAFGIYVMVLMYIATHGDARFLAGQTVTRGSIWLGQMGYMVCLCALFALVRVALALIGFYGTTALSAVWPSRYGVMAVEDIGQTWGFVPSRWSAVLWRTFTGLLLGGLFAYCYGSLFRRWKGWTIALTVGIPLLAFVSLVMPFLYVAMNTLEEITSDSSAAMRIIMKNASRWIEWIRKGMEFFEKYWHWIVWSAALCTMPITWAVMRKTRQPG